MQLRGKGQQYANILLKLGTLDRVSAWYYEPLVSDVDIFVLPDNPGV